MSEKKPNLKISKIYNMKSVVKNIAFFFIALSLVAFSAVASKAAFQTGGTDNFQIRVPKKSEFAIFQTTAIVTLNADAPVTFTIKDPEGEEVTIGPLSAGSDSEFRDFPIPSGLTTQDSVTIVAPDGSLSSDDPGRYRYIIHVFPNTNTDFSGGTCVDVMPVSPGEEFFTIRVEPTDPKVTGVCLVSFDLNTSGSECFDAHPIDPEVDSGVATVVGFPAPQPCEQFRPDVDVVLVLDKSGSMNSSTLGGAPDSKIQALRDAVVDFVDVWDNLRNSEGLDAPNGDRIGLLFFDSNEHWMNDVGVPAWSSVADGLHNFDTIKSTITSHINEVNAGGSTSMGDGLVAAASAFNLTNDHRKVILLMSNGKENTTLRVSVDDPSDPQEVQTYSGNPADATSLPNQNHLQIYSVTVGTSSAVSPDINEDIARATGGFYINSEDNAELLRPFFIELLQNFVKFNTWETLRMVSESVTRQQPSYLLDFPVSTTTRAFSVNLLWNRGLAVLRLTLIPPGGGDPIVKTGQGAIRINVELPLNFSYDPLGKWNVKIELIDPIGHVNKIPFDIVILGDDLAVKSDLSIIEADYVPGDQIRLQAKVTEFGKPVLNIGSNTKDKLLVEIVKPGAGIGDLLSDSTASTEQPSSDDTMTDADAKLHNELQEHPDQLVRNPDTIMLLDNGDSANGDDAAGDGIYSAAYRAELPGHYNFLFALEGTTQSAGRFSRQQLKTIHVRSVPDVDSTEVQTSIQQTADGNILTIDMTPRTKFGHRMGPGWANYFWFTAPGQSPFKAQDNMDGTYTATLIFSGDTPPKVSLHFLNVSVIIDDSVTSEKLPVPLDGNNMFLPDVKPQEEPCSCFDLWCHIKRFFN